MIPTTSFEKDVLRSKPEDKYFQRMSSKSNEVEITEHLFKLIPCNSRLRYCVDLGTRNGENFVGNTLITHSLLVSNDKKEHDRRRGHETFKDNDNECGQNTWFGVLMQPDARAFQNLKRLHEPLGNLCLQISPSTEEGPDNDDSLERILIDHVSDLPLDFDFLGLNEAGYSNYWVVRNFLTGSSYRPKVICISYDSKHPHDVTYIPDPNNEQEKPSLQALISLMSCFDYQLTATTLRCCFFARSELYESYLTTRIRHHNGGILSIPENELQKSHPRLNHYRKATTIWSSDQKIHDNDIVGNKILVEQQSVERKKTGTEHSQQLSIGGEKHPDTLGKQWLLQRKNMIVPRSTESFMVDSDQGVSLTSQGLVRSSPIKRELGVETEMYGYMEGTQLKRLARENTIGFSNTAAENSESRDDFLPFSTTTTNESKLYFRSKMERDAPPDPAGDTIVQKIQQNLASTTENSNGIRESVPEIEVKLGKEEKPTSTTGQKLSTPKNQSILELKNELLKLSQNNESNDCLLSEDPGYAINAGDVDDFSTTPVPTDLRALCGPPGLHSNEERLHSVRNLIEELQRNGHAMICGTAISRFLCRDALFASNLILKEADESVRNSCRSKNGVLRGYTPKCSEQSGSSDLKDMIQKFRLGSEEGDPRNVWPVWGTLDEDTDEYIRVSFQEYHDSLRRLAISITKSIYETISYDGTEHALSSSYAHDPNSSLLTVINCECGSRHDTGRPLVTSHNDASLVTILLVDGGDCANIQHESTEGKWESVRLPTLIPNDPVFMLYAGESLRKLSGDRIPSNSRRIVPSLGDQIVNGLLFSLMPSDTKANLFPEDKPKTFRQKELASPIARLTSELNDIGEMFQSYVFSEDENTRSDQEVRMYATEENQLHVDPFIENLEDARRVRKNHIDSLRFVEKNPSRSTTLLGSPQLPIIIEPKSATASSTKMIEIDKSSYNPILPVSIDQKSKQNGSKTINSKNLLPVASPWKNSGSNENKNGQDNSLEIARDTVSGYRKPRGEKKNNQKYSTRQRERKDANSSLNFGKAAKERNENIMKRRKEISRLKSKPPNQINFIQSSEASVILDEILGNSSDDEDVEKAESKRKTWHASDNYVPFRGSVVEWKMRENAEKIKKASLKWGKRGYSFGCDVSKEFE